MGKAKGPSRSSAAVVCIDRNRRIVSCNSAALQLFGRRGRPLKGRCIDEVLSGMDFRVRPGRLTQRLPARAGPVRVSVSSSLLRVRGCFYKVLVITRVRARRAANEEQRLSSLIAHDLRAALGAVAMALDVLRTTYSPSKESYARTADDASAAIRFMDHLVEDLVQTARGDAHQLPLHRQAIRPRNLLEEALGGIGPLLRDRVVAVQCPERLPYVEADPHRITQVVANLLNNAARVTQSADLSISVHREKAHVRFSVVDGGPGLPPSAIAVLSGLPTAAPPQTRRGLGLLIARTIVEAHGGRIWADTVPSGGGRVSFTLPLAAQVTATPTVERALRGRTT